MCIFEYIHIPSMSYLRYMSVQECNDNVQEYKEQCKETLLNVSFTLLQILDSKFSLAPLRTSGVWTLTNVNSSSLKFGPFQERRDAGVKR